MALIKTPIQTTGGFRGADDTPMAGAKVVFTLDKDDSDTISKEIVLKGKVEFTLDIDGKIPSGAGVWPNSRGHTKSNWKIKVIRTTGSGTAAVEVILVPEVSVAIQASVTPVELGDILNASYIWPA